MAASMSTYLVVPEALRMQDPRYSETGLKVSLQGNEFELPFREKITPTGCKLGLFWFDLSDHPSNESESALIEAAAGALAEKIGDDVEVVIAPPSEKSNMLIEKAKDKVNDRRSKNGGQLPLNVVQLHGGKRPLDPNNMAHVLPYQPITAGPSDVRLLGISHSDAEDLRSKYPEGMGSDGHKRIMLCDDVLSSGATFRKMEEITALALGLIKEDQINDNGMDFHPFSGAVVMREGDIPVFEDDQFNWVQHVFQAPVIVLN